MRNASLFRSMVGAGTVTTLAAIPPFLLSAQSVLMESDLGFDETQLGFAVSGFFAAAALTSLALGRRSDVVGPRLTMVISGLLAAASGLVIAFAQSYAVLLGALVVAGVANAGLQLTANMSVANDLPPGQRGLGYGIKQSAIPFSILIGGVAVPVVAVTVGWRWTYLAVAVGALAVVAAALRIPRRTTASRVAAADLLSPPRTALLLTFAAMSMASMAVNSLGAFLPAWSFRSGLTPSQAGLLVGLASAGSILMRVLGGAAADRRRTRHLPVVARNLGIGTVGIVLIASGNPGLLVVGAVIAFAYGWGWPGLLMFAVVRMGRDRPGLASTSVQAGAFLGGACGPALFGLVVASSGYRVAWASVGALMLVSAALLFVARASFIADLSHRPADRGRPG
jgi:MFS family permease